jgi:hypothetical protein
MRRSSFCIGTTAFVGAIVLFASAAFAFSFRVGSFHITFSSHRHHHYRHHLFARGRSTAPVHSAPGRAAASALFYPQLALPDIFANIFSPASSWPFDYQAVVVTAFTKPKPQNAQLCEPQSDLADKFLRPVDAVLELTDAQAQLLDKLGDALDGASGALTKSCPTEIPSAPIARLQLMDAQIGQLAAALGGVRQPLQDFQRALTDEQLARFAAMIAASSASNAGSRPGNVAPGCSGDALSTTDRAMSLIDRTVQPTAEQREALNAAKAAFDMAASDLQADCSTPMPPTELGRLDMVEARLDTTRRALRSIRAALTNFEAKLSDEQKARLDATSFAAQ